MRTERHTICTPQWRLDGYLDRRSCIYKKQAQVAIYGACYQLLLSHTQLFSLSIFAIQRLRLINHSQVSKTTTPTPLSALPPSSCLKSSSILKIPVSTRTTKKKSVQKPQTHLCNFQTTLLQPIPSRCTICQADSGGRFAITRWFQSQWVPFVRLSFRIHKSDALELMGLEPAQLS